MCGNSFFHILWASRPSLSPCPYGIVVVVFHFDSGGRKASKRARNGWDMSHENMGWNLRFCVLHLASPWGTLGTSNAVQATFWKRTRWTSSNELDKQTGTIFSNETLGWLEGCGSRCGPMDDGEGWIRDIRHKVADFVPKIVHNSQHFVLVPALNKTTFSACEPQMQTCLWSSSVGPTCPKAALWRRTKASGVVVAVLVFFCCCASYSVYQT